MMKRLWAVLIVLLGISFAGAVSGQERAVEQGVMVERAQELFEQGVARVKDDPGLARELFGQSAAMFEAVVREGNINNHRLETNIGNANLLAGDVGRAVVHYRRALKLSPADERARAGLESARGRVLQRVEKSMVNRAIDAFFWWRGFVPRGWVLLIAGGGYVLGWVGVIVRRIWSEHFDRGWVIAGCFVASFAAGGMLIGEQVVLYGVDEAVVVQEAAGYNGPDAQAYEKTFQAPLEPGVEVVVEEERGDWVLVRLGDGRSTWVLAGSLGRV